MKLISMSLRFLTGLSLIFLLAQVHAISQEAEYSTCSSLLQSTNYHQKYHTTAHAVLDIESCIWTVNDSMYRLLDEIIDDAKEFLHVNYSLLYSDDVDVRISEAGRILKSIDDLLTKWNFICPAKGHVEWLYDGLTPKRWKSQDSIEAVISRKYNQHRIDNIKANRNGNFYVVDDRQFSLLYVAIAEELNLPFKFSEVARHYLIIHVCDSTRHLGWETLNAVPMFVDGYLKWLEVPTLLIENGMYLRPLSKEEIIGAALNSRAFIYMNRKIMQNAVSDFRNSARLYRTDAQTWNQLAWIYVTDTIGPFKDPTLAKAFSDSAIALYGPEERWSEITGYYRYRLARYLDTRAAAFSNLHMYEQAVRVEESVVDMIESIKPSPTFNAEEMQKSLEEYRRLLEHYRTSQSYDVYREE